MTKVTTATAMQHLKSLIDRIDELEHKPRFSDEFKLWDKDVSIVVSRIFGSNSGHADSLEMIKYSPIFVTPQTSGHDFDRAFQRGLNRVRELLSEMLREVEHYGIESDPLPIGNTEVDGEPDRDSHNVFIVHGHDHSTKEEVATFIRQIGLAPVILHKQANKGMTIIEKFEAHANVAYAVVLLTPDDFGGSQTSPSQQCERARQNVIFELGFFFGKLGRDRVCGIKCGDVETPSDYNGIVYIDKSDDESWKAGLMRELQAAGLNVDTDGLA